MKSLDSNLLVRFEMQFEKKIANYVMLAKSVSILSE